MNSALVAAAQYLRMSKEHQQYSLQNQAAAIKDFADRHGFELVKTYEDAGRSGLMLRNRVGLRQLLNDVMQGNATYRAILVYDVSRWGRFQDTDESAHYEFLCKHAGVPIHYCAEQFTNDGTVPNTILKALKRTMAGEYSRELSVKVFDGKKRLAQLGFRQGGSPGYGLRRLLISAEGKRKQILGPGEYKNISTDRVVLVPGTKSEVGTVREIYAMALRRKRPCWILRELNRRGIPSSRGGRWDCYAVVRVLTNPKYTGCNVWGVTSQRLRSPARRVLADNWVVKAHAFPPIVDQRTFDRVQALLRDKTLYKSDEQLLKKLKRFWASKGRLSQNLIEAAPHLPSLTAYRRRFGNARRMYELIGYKQWREYFDRCERARKTRRMRDGIASELQQMFPERVEVIRPAPNRRPSLQLDGTTMISVLVCPSRGTVSGRRSWVLNPGVGGERRNTCLVCLANLRNDGVDYLYLLPPIQKIGRLKFGINHLWLRAGKRLPRLRDFCDAMTILPPQAH